MALLATLLGALVGGGVTSWTSWQATKSSQRAQQLEFLQRQQAQAEDFRQKRVDEQRIKRTEAYRAYLRAADDAIAGVKRIVVCAGALRVPAVTEKEIDERLPRCGVRYASEFGGLLRSVSKSTDSLFIYGSQSSRGVSRTLNVNLSYVEAWQTGLAPVENLITKFGSLVEMFLQISDVVVRHRELFQGLMCKELNPIDSENC